MAILLTLVAGCGDAKEPVDDTVEPEDVDTDDVFVTDTGAELSLRVNLETAGVVVTGDSLSPQMTLHHRLTGTETWGGNPPLAALRDGRLAGSFFGLVPGREYDAELRTPDGKAVWSDAFTTQRVEPLHQTGQTFFVSAAAVEGGDGSEGAPFATIGKAVGAASPGTDIIIGPGVYREEVLVLASGAPGQYIRLLGQPGAILDGAADVTALEWQPEGEGLYSTPWPGPALHYVRRDGLRSFQYGSPEELRTGLPGVDEGWVHADDRLWVRAAEHPTAHQWSIPALGTGIRVLETTWIWIQGLEIRDFGAGEFPKGIDVQTARDIVIRNNHIHASPSPIWVRDSSGRVRIESNRIDQKGTAAWTTTQVMGSPNDDIAIHIEDASVCVVRGNIITSVASGIVTAGYHTLGKPEVAVDVDVYDNRLASILVDGLEPEGECINHRFRRNSVDGVHNGISLQPIGTGPVWVTRNRFTAFGQAGVKAGSGSVGPIFLFHNTFWTDAAGAAAILSEGDFESLTSRNNLIVAPGPGWKVLKASANDFDFDLVAATPAASWGGTDHATVGQWCAASQQECSGLDAEPGIVNPGAGGWALSPGGSMVDRATPIPGINDNFAGAQPDHGYVEAGGIEPVPAQP